MRRKMISLVIALVMAGSLFIAEPALMPASAGTLAYTTETMPGTVTASFLDYTVSFDGNTIYGVVGTNVLYKSTNGGSIWSTIPVTGASGFTLVAVAPDDANVVAAANATAVWITTNGAATGGVDSWNNAGTPGSVTTIKDMAISPAVTGIRQITVAGNTGSGPGIATLNLGGALALWTNIVTSDFINGTLATTTAYSVRYSPSYVQDRILTAVGQDSASGDVSMNLFRFTSNITGLWNAGAGFTDYTGAGTSTGLIVTVVPAAAISSADQSLAPTYNGADSASRNAFVAIDAGVATTGNGIYQLKDSVSQLISDAVRMRSVAFNGTNLVAGRADNNVTYRSSDPLAPAPTLTATSSFQRPSGGVGAVAANTKVAWAGANVVASTNGNESAFSRSTDNGTNYQDVNNYNSTANVVVLDLAVAADGSKWYMVTTGNGTDTDVNVWAKTGTTWERLMSIIAPAPATFTLRLAPENSSVLYLVQNGSQNLYYTDDGGKNNWILRIANENVVDLAVESSQVIYYANGTNVRSSTNGGSLWNDPVLVSLSTGSIPFSLRSLGANLLIETTTAGVVSYSTNGGVTWTRPATITGGGSLMATAGNLSSGTYLFAAGGPGNTLGAANAIMRYKIGSVAPDNIWKAISPATSATEYFSALTLNNGILYAHSQDTAGVGSKLYRSLNPTAAGETSVSFGVAPLLAGPTLGTSPDFNIAAGRKSNLQISTAAGVNILWAIDQDAAVSEESGDSATVINDEVYSFNDTLVMAGPTLVSPEEGFQDAVNPVNGYPYNFAFSWNRPSLASAYQLQVAYDNAFSQRIQNILFMPADPAESPVSYAIVANLFNPGTTYYWRVRATSPVESPWSIRSFSIAPLGPAPQIQVSINAPDWVPQGVDFTVPVAINQVNNFDAASYRVSFNATILRLDNVTAGQIGANGVFTSVPVDLWTQNVTGTYNIVQNVPGTLGVSGSGSLAVLHFHALGSIGTGSDITLTNGALSNNSAQGIPAVWVNDSLYISFFRMGDVNGDGNVNALDITKLERIIAGLDP